MRKGKRVLRAVFSLAMAAGLAPLAQAADAPPATPAESARAAMKPSDCYAILSDADADSLLKREALRALQEKKDQGRELTPRLLQDLQKKEKDSYWIAEALGAIGDPAAIAPLTEMLKDPNLKEPAIQALSSFGPAGKAAIPALLEKLQKTQGHDRGDAAGRLVRVQADPTVAVPALAAAFREEVSAIEAGKTRDFPADREIGQALISYKGAAVPPLMEMLDGPSAYLSNSSMSLLGDMGAAAAPAVDVIAKRLSADDAEARRYAAQQLKKIGVASPSAIKALANAAVKETDLAAFQLMVDTLAKYGPASAPALPQLMAMLTPAPGTAAASFRRTVLHALGEMGPAAAPALPKMAEAVKAASANPKTDRYDLINANFASMMIAKIDSQHPQGLPALIEAAKHPGERGNDAVERLGYVGRPAKAALPILLERAKAPIPNNGDERKRAIEVRGDAISSIAMIGADPSCVPVLIEIFKNPGVDTKEAPKMRIVTTAALGTAGPAARSAVPLLLAEPSLQDNEVLYFALSRIAPDARDATSILRKRLSTGQAWDKIYSAIALLKMNPADEEARAALISNFPRLARKLEVEQQGAPDGEAAIIERDFCDACSLLGPAAKQYAPQLQRIVESHSDSEMRKRAAEALQQVKRQ